VHSIIRKPFDIEILGGLMTAIVESRISERQRAVPQGAVAEEVMEMPPPPPPPKAC
jgi:hypothetical protein